MKTLLLKLYLYYLTKGSHKRRMNTLKVLSNKSDYIIKRIILKTKRERDGIEIPYHLIHCPKRFELWIKSKI